MLALLACSPASEPVSLTVYLRPQGASILTPDGTGTLTVDLDPPRTVTVRNGRVRLDDVPARHAGERVGVSLEFPGYRLADEDATILVEQGGLANLGIVAETP